MVELVRWTISGTLAEVAAKIWDEIRQEKKFAHTQ
jgi:hypothetical protein